jgi:type I restriction enzyme M protein
LERTYFTTVAWKAAFWVCNMNKPKERKGKVIFIDGKDEIRLERSTAYLKDEHIKRMADAYWNFKNEEGFTKVMTSKEILEENDGNLSIQLYVKTNGEESTHTVEQLLAKSKANQDSLQNGFDELMSKLNELGIEAI